MSLHISEIDGQTTNKILKKTRKRGDQVKYAIRKKKLKHKIIK